jgi:hypothetical protein
MKRTNRKKSRAERPTLPELDQTNRSVFNSLTSVQSRRSYRHAIDEFYGLFLPGTAPGIEPGRRRSDIGFSWKPSSSPPQRLN